MAKEQNASATTTRVDIIRAVETPLGFFVLTVLIVEGILGTLCGTSFSGSDRTIGLWGMLGIICLLIFVVSLFALFRPGALSGKSDINPEKLTAPLNAEIKRINAEIKQKEEANYQLEAENARLKEANHQLEDEKNRLKVHLDSQQARIRAILLARGSATFMDIVQDLGLALTDQAGQNQVRSIIGSLAEAGIVEADGMKPAGYYRLKQK
jgi:FtsZ-binding cell division protein ZapB